MVKLISSISHFILIDSMNTVKVEPKVGILSKKTSPGIAQGTVLGPLIFIFYINDIIDSIKNCHLSLFADDCVLYLDGNNWTRVSEKIQQDLISFENWCMVLG